MILRRRSRTHPKDWRYSGRHTPDLIASRLNTARTEAQKPPGQTPAARSTSSRLSPSCGSTNDPWGRCTPSMGHLFGARPAGAAGPPRPRCASPPGRRWLACRACTGCRQCARQNSGCCRRGRPIRRGVRWRGGGWRPVAPAPCHRRCPPWPAPWPCRACTGCTVSSRGSSSCCTTHTPSSPRPAAPACRPHRPPAAPRTAHPRTPAAGPRRRRSLAPYPCPRCTGCTQCARRNSGCYTRGTSTRPGGRRPCAPGRRALRRPGWAWAAGSGCTGCGAGS
mmetsp:Transcript_34168/g.74650  ORF Transcript_34168/g.74650 Transcript_34168/m.74650 type:complete len:279 (+) Transcript_34168:55-891(+)